MDCDKNFGSAVISHQLYKELCLKNLNTPGFEVISNDPLEEINLKITWMSFSTTMIYLKSYLTF